MQERATKVTHERYPRFTSSRLHGVYRRIDRIVLSDGESRPVGCNTIQAQTLAQNTTARKALGAGAGMAVGTVGGRANDGAREGSTPSAVG